MEFKQSVEKLEQAVGAMMQQIGGVTSAMMQVQSEILTLKNAVGQVGNYLQNLDQAAGKRIKALEDHCGVKAEVAAGVAGEAPVAEVAPLVAVPN